MNGTVEDYRLEQFEELGFNKAQAESLRDAKEWTRMSDGRRYESTLPTYKVRNALEAGASHELILEIFT